MEVYNQILELYTKITGEKAHIEKALGVCISSSNHIEAAKNEIKLKQFETFAKELKIILKGNFQYNIEKSIQDAQITLKKEEEFSKGAWEMYGSELAGDFNRGEVNAYKRLSMLNELIK